MKQTLLGFCLLLTLSVFSTAAFGQIYGGFISSEPQIYHAPDHPAHASYAPMQAEQSIYANNTTAYAHGERPVSDFPQLAQESLGEAARQLKKQHEHVKKARVVWENQ